MLIYPLLLRIRIENEEEILTKGLKGYKEYKEAVKWRLFPHLVGRQLIMNIVELFYENKNEELAIPMAKYMKNKFPFLGIKKPEEKNCPGNF